MHKKVKADEKNLTYKDGFYLCVDDVKYGPFLEKYRAQYKDLDHYQGVKIEPVRLARGWVEPVPPPKKTKEDKTTPLLDGLDFKPTFKTW